MMKAGKLAQLRSVHRQRTVEYTSMPSRQWQYREAKKSINRQPPAVCSGRTVAPRLGDLGLAVILLLPAFPFTTTKPCVRDARLRNLFRSLEHTQEGRIVSQLNSVAKIGMWTLVKDCPPFDIIRDRFRLFPTCNAVPNNSWLGILVSVVSCHLLIFSSDSEH